MASPIAKIAALCSFSLLIFGFVAYRSGAFTFTSQNMASSLYQESQDTSRPDTAVVAPIRDNYMNTSKSGIMANPNDFTLTVTPTKKVKKTKPTKKQKIKENLIIPSSKSGAIFVPENGGL